jgi:LPS export ABC transporter permease LptG/LPS export ABC transporter permease LptF
MSNARLNRIFYREITGPCLIALLILTFVVFTREFGRLAEMLIRRNADAMMVAQIVLFILPSVLIFSIPFAFLIGTLIGFSRLSGDSEIIAMRASGVSVWQMLKPVLKVATLVALITAAFTCSLLPRGNWNLRLLTHELGFKPLQSEIKARVFNEQIPNTILYVEDIDLRTSIWKGVFVHTSSSNAQKRTILASRGDLITSEDGRRLQLHLEDGTVYDTNDVTPERDSMTRFGTQDVLLQLPEMEAAFSKPKRPKDKTIVELWNDRDRGKVADRNANNVEMYGRISLPLAALVFGVLAVTLGISRAKSGRGYGFVVSIVIAFSYFVMFDMGRNLAAGGVIPVWLGGWGPDILLAVVAVLSVYAASRERLVLERLIDNRLWATVGCGLRRLARAVGGLFRGLAASAGRRFWDVCTVCVQLTRVVDLYMLRNFLFYLVPTLLICTSLFYLFTFFELMDDIFKNNIPYRMVFDYFLFLIPQILILLVPISILIATLVTFGVLDKASEVVAFKSCGISIYRIAVPVVLLSALMGGGLFVLQEYVTPYTNQKQDSLRNVIKGRPAQTYYQLGRNWIFGEDDRLYNYRHFDSQNDIFADMSVYELDISENRLNWHLYAKKVRWDPATKNWIFSQGWRRDFTDGYEQKYETFNQRYFAFPERPSYFEQEVKESSKMTYGELKEYIHGLQRAGFDVDQLQTELYRKLSFPVVSLIMTILGIPFSFSMGRKGALYGIAAGVIIGIFYWGMFGAFEVMGANGLLAPVLAAWGPNILFSTAGLLMLSWVKT